MRQSDDTSRPGVAACENHYIIAQGTITVNAHGLEPCAPVVLVRGIGGCNPCAGVLEGAVAPENMRGDAREIERHVMRKVVI